MGTFRDSNGKFQPVLILAQMERLPGTIGDAPSTGKASPGKYCS